MKFCYYKLYNTDLYSKLLQPELTETQATITCSLLLKIGQVFISDFKMIFFFAPELEEFFRVFCSKSKTKLFQHELIQTICICESMKKISFIAVIAT